MRFSLWTAVLFMPIPTMDDAFEHCKGLYLRVAFDVVHVHHVHSTEAKHRDLPRQGVRSRQVTEVWRTSAQAGRSPRYQ